MDLMVKDVLIPGKVDWKGRPARKGEHGGMRASLLVLAMFGFENMATVSLGVNLITYFNGTMHYNLAEAANHLTNFLAIGYMLTIFAATLADAYIGRFRIVFIGGFLEFLGLALLTLQAHYKKLTPPLCNIFDPKAKCDVVSGGNAALLYSGLYLLAIGSAGVKAAVPSHGADQFDEKDPKEAIQMSSFFNWLLGCVAVGGCISVTLFVWIQDNKGWDWGFGLPTIAMLLGVLVFFAGLPQYRIHVIQGSTAIAEIIQVFVAAFRNRNLQLPEDAAELYEIHMDKEAALKEDFLPHRDVLRCLDKASIQTSAQSGPENLSPWKLCRVTQVENAKILISLIPIFLCTIIMTICLAQLQTFSIQQGSTMDTKITKSFNMPPASIPIIPIAFLVILTPLYDQICVPFLRKFTGHLTGITYLQRIGVGLLLSCISMAIAAIMEVKRKNVARDHNMLDALPVLQPLPISVFWLSFQYFIFGIADLFTFVGLLEFFYSQAPKGLKSISSCFLWSSMAIGYFLSSVLISIVNSATKGTTTSGGWLGGNNINRNHLELFYWLLSLLSLTNFLVYLFVAKRYKYRVQTSETLDDSEDYQLKSLKT